MTHPPVRSTNSSGLTTPHRRGFPHGFMQHHGEGMAGSPGCPYLGSPSLKPTTTTAQPTMPASKACVDHETDSTPFVLALRAAGAAC